MSSKRRLSGPHKIAVLLRLMEPTVAREILSNLGDRDLARIHRADHDLGDLDEATCRQVASDFRERVGAGKFDVGHRRVADIIRDTFDEARVEKILGQADAAVGRISDTLGNIDARVIARVLSREYPQTSALVISQLARDHASEVVLALPEELRTDVMVRVARMERISADMLAELNRALARELSGFESSVGAQELEGVDVAVQLLMHMDRGTEEKVLEGISALDGELADTIREHMFVFDDLLAVDDRGIQQLLRNIENAELVLALKGADEGMRRKFLDNVSKRVAASLEEDLEAMGPVRLSEVEGAQQSIATKAREMIDRGEMMVAGRGDDALV